MLGKRLQRQHCKQLPLRLLRGGLEQNLVGSVSRRSGSGVKALSR